MRVTVVSLSSLTRLDGAAQCAMASASRREPSVARQILVLQVARRARARRAALSLAAYDARRDARRRATDRAVAVAQAVADSPTVVGALDDADPSATLQPFAERVRRDTGVDFVVVMGLDRTRFTHPDPSEIGEKFIGDLGGAPRARSSPRSTPAPRAVDAGGGAGPRRRSRGRPGLRRDHGLHDRPAAASGPRADPARGLAVLAAGLGGRVAGQPSATPPDHGLGEREITRMYEYYSAGSCTPSARACCCSTTRGRVQLVNDEARRLLRLPDDVLGRPVHDLGLPPGLVAAALGRTAESDDIYVAGDHVLVVSSAPASWQGGRSARSSPCATTPTAAR
jgi:type II secretory pathway pseudopilin PulG